MKWTSGDLEMYTKAKEYIDTVLIPMIPITLQENATAICEMGEFISIIATELEREYRGRMLLIPSFTYLKQEHCDELIQRLNTWKDSLMDENVKQLIFLTSDPDWKLYEKELQGTLLWIPSISLQHVDKKSLEHVIQSQMKLIQTIVINLWNKESRNN